MESVKTKQRPPANQDSQTQADNLKKIPRGLHKIPSHFLLGNYTNKILRIKKASEQSKLYVDFNFLASQHYTTALQEVLWRYFNLHKSMKFQRFMLDSTYGEHIQNHLEHLGANLAKNAIGLRSLKIHDLSFHINDKSIEAISSTISRHFTTLRSLKLLVKGPFYETSNATLEVLGSNITNNCFHLEELTLKFRNCKDINDETLIKLSSKISKNLVNLKHLTLSFKKGAQISEDCLETMASNITSRLVNLNKLSIAFKECPNISSKGVIPVGSIITKNLPGLRQLSLSFRGCTRVTDRGLSALQSEITAKLTELRVLKLSFYKCKVTDKAIKALGKDISTKLPGLRKLKLGINHFNYSFLQNTIQTNLKELEKISFKSSGKSGGTLEDALQLKIQVLYC